MKHMKIKIVLPVVALMFFLLGLPFTTHAGYVSGYFKRDGTYVSGYYRNTPYYDIVTSKGITNSINPSRYYPTKIYSNSLYTAPYITQPNTQSIYPNIQSNYGSDYVLRNAINDSRSIINYARNIYGR